jgi:AAA+ lid domain
MTVVVVLQRTGPNAAGALRDDGVTSATPCIMHCRSVRLLHSRGRHAQRRPAAVRRACYSIDQGPEADVQPAPLQGAAPDVVKALRDPIVAATIDVYSAASSTLLPTPSKSHYLFNLRDVARVVSGMLMLPPERLGSGAGAKAKFLRLWVHETLRVFYDRCTFCLSHASRFLLSVFGSHLWYAGV